MILQKYRQLARPKKLIIQGAATFFVGCLLEVIGVSPLGKIIGGLGLVIGGIGMFWEQYSFIKQLTKKK